MLTTPRPAPCCWHRSLAQLAEYEATTLSELRALVEPNSAAVRQTLGRHQRSQRCRDRKHWKKLDKKTREDVLPEQFLVRSSAAARRADRAARALQAEG